MKKKRTDWDRFIWAFQHPIGWERAKGIALAHRRRILRENIEYDYRMHKKEYDREFEREWRKFEKEMWEPKKTPDYIYYATGQRYW